MEENISTGLLLVILVLKIIFIVTVLKKSARKRRIRGWSRARLKPESKSGINNKKPEWVEKEVLRPKTTTSTLWTVRTGHW